MCFAIPRDTAVWNWRPRSCFPTIEDYLKLFRDAGWERVLEVGGWQYFRTASKDAPEIYTDSYSRIAKYHRLYTAALVLTIAPWVRALLDCWSFQGI